MPGSRHYLQTMRQVTRLFALASAWCVACSAGGGGRPGSGGPLTSGGGAGASAAGGTGSSAAPPGGGSGSTTAPPIFHFDGGAGHMPGCNDINVGFEKIISTVLLLVDESGSMADNKYPSGGAQTRWRVLHDALLADGGLVQKLSSDVRFGFIGYTGDGTAATCP